MHDTPSPYGTAGAHALGSAAPPVGAQTSAPADLLDGFNVDSMLCTRCTLGCNVIRIVSRDTEKIVLCGKNLQTQQMLDAQRERMGIPAPGVAMRS